MLIYFNQEKQSFSVINITDYGKTDFFNTLKTSKGKLVGTHFKIS